MVEKEVRSMEVWIVILCFNMILYNLRYISLYLIFIFPNAYSDDLGHFILIFW